MSLTLSEDQESQLLEAVKEDLVAKIWEHMEKRIDQMTCVSLSRASGMLDLSTSQARRVLNVIDFGARDHKVSLSEVARVIDERTVKKAKKGRQS